MSRTNSKSTPAPGTGARHERTERHADFTRLSDGQKQLLRYIGSRNYAVSTRDMVRDLGYDDAQQAGNVIRPLWEDTVLVDRVEVRQITDGDDHGSRRTAHVYWLTDAGKVVAAGLR